MNRFRLWREARRRPWLALGSLLALSILLVALLAPTLAPWDPLRTFPEGLTPYGAPAGPAPGHPLGFDSRGRDLLTRLLYGARLSLTIGLGAMALAMLVALLVGGLAGYFGGAVDQALMRLTDIVMAFPAVLLALALGAVLPRRSAVTLICVIAAVTWTGAARVFRSEVLSIRERPYVEAARALGASHARILLRHVLPQLLPTLAAMASVAAATTILLDAGLAFLGIGIPAPAPTWGSMLQEAQTWHSAAPWLALWPGLAVLLTAASFQLIAFDLGGQRPVAPSAATEDGGRG